MKIFQHRNYLTQHDNICSVLNLIMLDEGKLNTGLKIGSYLDTSEHNLIIQAKGGKSQQIEHTHTYTSSASKGLFFQR